MNIKKNRNDCGVYAMMNIYAYWNEVFPLDDLQNIQYSKYWIVSDVVKVKNDKMFQKSHFRGSNYENQKCVYKCDFEDTS